MGQGLGKWNQINQGYLGGPFGIHLRGPWPIWWVLEGSEAKFKQPLGQIWPFLTSPVVTSK